LCRSTSGKIDEGFVFCNVVRPGCITICLFEVLIKAKLATSLSTVSKKLCSPSSPKPRKSVLCPQQMKSPCDALILSWINLD
jgi:hypothetical protein